MSERATILVTGGAGFVGSHFARLAAERGRELLVLDDLSGGHPATLPGTIPLVIGDFGDRALVGEILRERRIGAVAHFAGKMSTRESVQDPGTYFDVNVVRTLALLTAIRDEGVTACLVSSTADVYGIPRAVPVAETARTEPSNPFGSTRLAIELALAAWSGAYGLRWCALRCFNPAGAHPDGTLRESHEPETHLIPLAIDAGLHAASPVRVFGVDYDTPDGTCIRDYVHVLDLASAHLDALEILEAGRSLGALNLATGRGHSVREVIGAAGSLFGRPVPYTVAPRRPGDPPRLVGNPAAARAALGWHPVRSDLATILEDTLRSRALVRARSRSA